MMQAKVCGLLERDKEVQKDPESRQRTKAFHDLLEISLRVKSLASVLQLNFWGRLAASVEDWQ